MNDRHDPHDPANRGCRACMHALRLEQLATASQKARATHPADLLDVVIESPAPPQVDE